MKSFTRRLWRHRRTRVGLLLVSILLVLAVLAPLFAPYDPTEQLDLVRRQTQPPSLTHPFGTDFFSRDVFSRVLYGGRISLAIAFLAVLVSVTVGTVVGWLAGTGSRMVDAILMRTVDAALAIPRIFLLLVVLALWNNVGIGVLVVILGFTGWFGTSRLVRAEILSLRERDFIRAAHALGIGRIRLFVRHLLPNVAAPLIVTATLGVGHVILIEAGLSFLGIGVRPPTPSWGSIIQEGQSLLAVAPWIAAFPGLAIVLTVVGFSLLGDGLRDALDPRSR